MRHLLLSTLLLLATFTFSQTVTTPPSGANQKSVNTQYIGSLAFVTVTYNSPDVTDPQGNDRNGQIWGQLVPYGLTDLGFGLRNPAPWRAGANENTTIEFSHDVMIEGKSLAAGTYGLFISVEETDPWTIIFSNNSTAWGSFFYKASDDALKVEVSPEDNEYHEWLTYEFTDRQADHCTLALMWENKKLPFKIEVSNMEEIYLTTMRQELENSAGFNWQSWNQAANYCLQNDINLKEALSWVETSITGAFVGQEDFVNLSTKAQILNKLGQTDEGQTTLLKAIDHPSATAFQIHGLGRGLITQGEHEKALEVFTASHKKFDGAWPTEVGMARGLSALGKYEEAIKHVEIAVEQAPDQLNKDYLTKIITSLKEGKDMN